MHEMHGCWPLTKNKMSCRDTIQHCTVNEFLCPKSKSPDTVAYALLRLCFCWLTFTACCMKLGSPTKQKEELLKTPSRNLLTIFVTLSDMVYDKKTSLNSTFSKSPLRSVPLSWISWWSIAPLDSCGSVWVKRGIMRKGLQVMRRKQFSFELVCITFSHWVSTHLYWSLRHRLWYDWAHIHLAYMKGWRCANWDLESRRVTECQGIVRES